MSDESNATGKSNSKVLPTATVNATSTLWCFYVNLWSYCSVSCNVKSYVADWHAYAVCYTIIAVCLIIHLHCTQQKNHGLTIAVPHADSATAAAGATDDKNNNTSSDSHADRYKAAIRAELDPSQLSPISRRRMIDRERKRLVTSIVDVTKTVAVCAL
jgi:hypothetical protein